VRQWIRDAKLPAIRAGKRKYLVRRSDLRRVIAFAGATPSPANGAGSLPEVPPAERERWDLASHARMPR